MPGHDEHERWTQRFNNYKTRQSLPVWETGAAVCRLKRLELCVSSSTSATQPDNLQELCNRLKKKRAQNDSFVVGRQETNPKEFDIF